MRSFFAARVGRALITLAVALWVAGCGGSGGGGGGGADDAPPVGKVTLGAEGGTVDGPDGTRMAVPKGALSGNVTLQVARDATGAPPLEGLSAVSPVYAVTPHGQAFGQPALFSIPLAALQLPAGTTPVLLKAEPDGLWRVMRNSSTDTARLAADIADLSYFVVGACTAIDGPLTIGGTGCPTSHELRLTLLDGNSPVQITRGPNGVQLPVWYVTDAPQTLSFVLDWMRPSSTRVDGIGVLGANGAFNPGGANTGYVEVSGGNFSRRFDVRIDPATTAGADGPNGRLHRVIAIAEYTTTGFRIGVGPVQVGFRFETDIPVLVRYNGPPITITQQPQPAAVSAVENTPFTLAMAATGSNLTIQWRYHESASDTAVRAAEGTNNQASYTSPPAQIAWTGRRYYAHVCATDSANRSRCVDTASAALSVTPFVQTATITAQPSPSDIVDGDTAGFGATVIGTPTPTLRWYFDASCSVDFFGVRSCTGTPLADGAGSGALAGATIAGATSANLTLTGVPQAANGARLALQVSQAGLLLLPRWSDDVLLTVRQRIVPAAITQPLVSPRSVQQGGSLDFTVVATGTQPIDYEWSIASQIYRAPVTLGSGPCAGAGITFPSAGVMRLANVPLACDGSIVSVAVSNAATPAGARPGSGAQLFVSPLPTPPSITSGPVTSIAVDEGRSTTLRVAYAGTAPITIQLQRFDGSGWVNVGAALDSANCPTACNVPTPVLDGTDHGASFRVHLGNAQGSVDTDVVSVAVNLVRTPVFTLQPQATAVDASQTTTPARFTFAVAADSGSFAYQWLVDGQPLADGTGVAGNGVLQGANVGGAAGTGRSGTLTLTNVPLAANGARLSVRATRSTGGRSIDATSNPATLSVNTGLPPNALTATQIVAGYEWSLVLRPDRTVWGWGAPNRTDGTVQMANLLDANRAQRPVQMYPAVLSDVRQIAGWYDGFWALKGDPGTPASRVLHWGAARSGSDGRGGDGQGSITGSVPQYRYNEAAPVEMLEQVNGAAQPVDRVCSIAAGSSRVLMIRAVDAAGQTTSCAPGVSKTVWMVGTLEQVDSFSLGVAVPLPGLPAAPPPAAVNATTAPGVYGAPYTIVLEDGRVFVFGDNYHDGLGLGSSVTAAWVGANGPIQVPAAWGAALATRGGAAFNLFVLRADGTVMTSGEPRNTGFLGLGPVPDHTPVNGPVPVLSDTCTALPCADVLSGVTDLAIANDQVTLALRQGRILAWGAANHPLQGGSTTRLVFPRLLPHLGSGYSAISTSSAHALAIGPGGAVYTWGRGPRGALGDGVDGSSANEPRLVTR